LKKKKILWKEKREKKRGTRDGLFRTKGPHLTNQMVWEVNTREVRQKKKTAGSVSFRKAHKPQLFGGAKTGKRKCQEEVKTKHTILSTRC